MQRNNNRYQRHDNAVPSDWKNFSEIRFKVSYVPTDADAIGLQSLFSTYGSVYKIEIGAGERIAYVTFRPVPDNLSWMNKVFLGGKRLKVDYLNYGSNTFIDQVDGRKKLKFHSFQARSLEMGVYLKPDIFVSEAQYIELVKFTINYQKLGVIIEFGFRSPNGISLFKLNFGFKDIDGEIYTELDDSGSRGTITIANKFPPKYWLLDKRLKSKGKFNWCYDDSWKRKTEIRVEPKKEEKKNIPLRPRMPDNSEQLGKWVVFRITFDLDYIGRKCFNEMIARASEYNLVPKPVNVNNNPLNVVNGTHMCKHVERSMLDFDILYMTECNLSFNYLHDYNLDSSFFSLLSQQSSQSALYILGKIFETKNRLYDPLSYLQEEVEELKSKNTVIKPQHVPSYCVMMRKVVITPTTMYILTPTIETSNRVIRHFRDKKNNFLRVQFVDEGSNKVGSTIGSTNDALYNRIFTILVNGIMIGDRHYEFLAFSSSQLRDHSCWFFAKTDDLTADNIRQWMGDFSNVNNVAKYAARMGQCFSSTRAIQYLSVNMVEIDDIENSGYTFSDGIGKISFSLAGQIAQELEIKIVPSAFQFRLAGCKGVLCQSRYVSGNQVQVRPSQRKFKSTHNVLEIIRYSTFIPAYLNRQAITLLSVLGVPDKIFIEMKDLQVKDLNKMLENDDTAIRVLRQNTDEHGVSNSLACLVKAGFLQKKDRYLMNLISLFRTVMLRDLKKKAKIRVNKGAFLLGVLDDTNSLKEGQVYCCINITDPNNQVRRKVIEGSCIVFRNPCFHPGDIRVVTAVKCKALSNLVDVIVFPAVGYRDIPSECSGGDLDGDDFTLIYDENLIPKIKDLEPMNYEAQKPGPTYNINMHDIKKFFVNYILNDQLGMIANAHLAKADYFDNGAFHGQCIRLAQLHSEAVDFPKTGIPAEFPPELRVSIFPDFMDKPDKPSYESKKVLGILYRSIKVAEYEPFTDNNFDERLYVPGFEYYLGGARVLKHAYDADIRGLMNQFGIATEFEITSGYIVDTIANVDRKRTRDVAKSVMDAFIPIRQHYRKAFEEEFYGEGTNVVSPVARNRMESKAYAWYYITYNSNDMASEKMISFPWIIYDILCDIAVRYNNRSDESTINIQ